MIEQNFVEISQIDGFLSFIWSVVYSGFSRDVSIFMLSVYFEIDWRDPWLIALFTFHITIFIMAIFTRNYGNFQALLFFCLLLLVYFSESINKLASNNWKIFSRQQYFDSNGLFISVVFSMPILINCMLMVGSWLYQSTQLMKNLKIAQLEERIKNEKKLQRTKSKED